MRIFWEFLINKLNTLKNFRTYGNPILYLMRYTLIGAYLFLVSAVQNYGRQLDLLGFTFDDLDGGKFDISTEF
jgi:hypothetical protein